MKPVRRRHSEYYSMFAAQLRSGGERMQPAYLADDARSCAVFCLRFASCLGGQTDRIQQNQDWKLL